MNRQQIMAAAAAAGAVFLLFYWTHSAFSSAIKSAESSLTAIEAKAEKAAALAAEAKSSGGKGSAMSGGLLSFLQTGAEGAGLAEKIGAIKPKTVPGAAEAATIRLEGLTYNEVVAFLQTVERYQNLSSSNVKISKRFDNEKLLNLVMDIIKK